MKKVIPFQIPKSNKEFVRYQVDEGKHFYDKLHQHPQWQLTFISEGKGQLLVGDYIGRFEPGDMYLFSANMPHVFRSDAEYFDPEGKSRSLGLTLFYDFQALGKSLSELEEFAALQHWTQRTRGCFKVEGETKSIVGETLLKMDVQVGLDRFLSALGILQHLQQPDDLQVLNKMIPQKDFTETEGKKMGSVMSYILAKSKDDITLDEMAGIAHLSKEAFCRFFKQRTGKTFTEFLAQVRIHQACQLLQESDDSISGIAYQSGFRNLSYFNRTFKKFRGETPKEYRRKLNGI
jgi:AraC-like DNA-binding protein